MSKKLEPLPKSDDDAYWDGAEKYISHPVVSNVCKTHGKNWKKHIGYIDNHDGTASCDTCGWGFILPGYLKIHDGKVVDLRDR